MSDNRPIRFLLNDTRLEVLELPVTTTVLQFLREQRGLSGTKEGCAEGDCGACSVVLAELVDGELQMRVVNACIQCLPTLDGKALYTVESLRCDADNLHPVQQALVETHGSQCGFCTPGFVMSLWGYYLEHQFSKTPPSRKTLQTALAGNLCRCTGYKPILKAGERMFELPEVSFDRQRLIEALQALAGDTPAALDYAGAGQRFFAPRDLDSLLALRRRYPDSTLLAGGTDVGLWTNKQFRELGTILYTGQVAELRRISANSEALEIGAAVSLQAAYRAICARYPQLTELWERFASPPIRHAGTLGGNVANGSPIGDSMPWLIALGAEVVLRGVAGERRLPLEQLYVGYMQQSRSADEVIVAVSVPLPSESLQFRCWKVSKRYDSDISAVCGAFALWLDNGVISNARIAFGGMAATPQRATQCEAALLGQSWSQATLERALAKLDEDYTPLSDMRASAEYRSLVARNLLKRFFLETDSHAGQPQTRAFAVEESC